MKTLLDFHDAAPDAGERLDFAAGLAQSLGAHLTSLSLTVEPAYLLAGGSPEAAEIWAEYLQAAREQASELAKAAAERLERAGAAADCRRASLPLAAVSRVAALHARYADLAILGPQKEASEPELRREVFDGALFESGRPALVVPSGSDPEKTLRKAMIAWDGSLHAARAVGDALPLLARAEAVSVVVVAPRVDPDALGEEPGGDVSLYLARHGLKVELHQAPDSGRGVAQVLSERARDFDAGMIVMGGFGHSRWRESLFGGVTQELMESTATPLFMAH